MVAVSPSSTPISASIPISPAPKDTPPPASRLATLEDEDTDRLAAGATVSVALLASELDAVVSSDSCAGAASPASVLSDTVATASSIDETVGAASLLALSCTVASRSICPLEGAVAAS